MIFFLTNYAISHLFFVSQALKDTECPEVVPYTHMMCHFQPPLKLKDTSN